MLSDNEEVPQEIEVLKNDQTFQQDTEQVHSFKISSPTNCSRTEAIENGSLSANQVDEIIEMSHSKTLHFQSEKLKISLHSVIPNRPSEVDTFSEKKSASTKVQTRRVEEVEEEIELSQEDTGKKTKCKALQEVQQQISEVEASRKKIPLQREEIKKQQPIRTSSSRELFHIKFDDSNQFARRVIELQLDNLHQPKGKSAQAQLCTEGNELRVEEKPQMKKRNSSYFPQLSPRISQIGKNDKIKACLYQEKEDEELKSQFRTIYISLFSLRLYHPFFQILSHQGAKLLLESGMILNLDANKFLHNQGEKNNYVYFVLSGKLTVSSMGGVNCQIKSGDTVGEQSIISSNPKLPPLDLAADSVITDEQSYLLMVSRDQYSQLKKKLFLLERKNDFLLIESLLSRNYTQKRSWRNFSRNSPAKPTVEAQQILAASEE